MPDVYYSVRKSAQVELEEKKSRFIAHCRPLGSEKDAEKFITAMRDKYPDASHNVYAWIAGLDMKRQKYSDDGEPQGTAGMPVLDVLQKNNVTQAGIVVTRYYGGVQLGAGGLVRAYTASASKALQTAGICRYQKCRKYKVTVSYAHLDKLRRSFSREKVFEIDCEFALDAVLLVAVPIPGAKRIYNLSANVTAGTALIEPDELIYLPLPLPDPPDSGTFESKKTGN